jgi:hypothetical protein
MEKVHRMMERDPVFSKMASESQANLMAEAFFPDNMLGGGAANVDALQQAKKHDRKDVFLAHHVLEKMDEMGGRLNIA